MGEKGNKRGENRLRVVPNFSSGIVERAKRERALKSPHARKVRHGGEREKFSLFDQCSILVLVIMWLTHQLKLV